MSYHHILTYVEKQNIETHMQQFKNSVLVRF